MGIFKSRQNKKFNYTPRFYEGDGNPYEIKPKFDDFRTTLGKTNLKGKFENAWDDFRNNGDATTNKRILMIIGILVFIFLLIIGFDLSIFFGSN